MFDLYTLVFKITNNPLPNWLSNQVSVSEIRGTITKQSNDLFVIRPNVKTGVKMTMATDPLLWTKIPQENRNTGSLSASKHRLRFYKMYF